MKVGEWKKIEHSLKVEQWINVEHWTKFRERIETWRTNKT